MNLKIKIVKRIQSIARVFKEYVSVSVADFNEMISKLELLNQNVYKTEYNLIKSTCVQIASQIEEESKLEYSMQLEKFKLNVDRDSLNYIIEKPKPLFDLDLIDWTKFD